MRTRHRERTLLRACLDKLEEALLLPDAAAREAFAAALAEMPRTALRWGTRPKRSPISAWSSTVALYHNHTRVDAVVTIRSLNLGVHDLQVPPGAILDVPEGTTAEFLASRRA